MFNHITSNLIQLLCFVYYSSNILEHKGRKINVTVKFIFAWILFSLINHNGMSTNKAIYIFVIYLLFMIITFKDTVIKKIYLTTVFYIFVASSEVVGTTLYNIVFQNIAMITSTSKEYLLLILISNMILFLLIFSYLKFRRLIIIENIPKSTWYIFLLPFTTIIIFISIDNYFIFITESYFYIVILIGLVFSNIAFIYSFSKSVHNINLKNEIKTMEEQMKLLEQHYKYNYNNLHELLHICTKLNNHVKNNDYQNISNEINKLTSTTFKTFNYILSNSLTVNTLINNKLKIIMENDIEIHTDIRYNEFESVLYSDIYIILNCLIDTAIKCSIESNNKYISINTNKLNNQFYIKILFSNDKYDKDEVISFLNIYNMLKKYDLIFNYKKQKITNYSNIFIMFNI